MMARAASTHDVVVLGAGGAGIAAARAAAAAGARVLLVDRPRDAAAPPSGLVAVAALAEVALRVWAVRTGGRLGVRSSGLALDWPVFTAHAAQAVAQSAQRRYTLLAGARVARIDGQARFTGPDTIEIDGAIHRFTNVVVATGSEATVPVDIGLEGVPYLTEHTLFGLPALPPRMVILGGAAWGAVVAQAFSRLGVRVTLIHPESHLDVSPDPQVGEFVATFLAAEGVDLRGGARAVGVERTVAGAQVQIGGGGTVEAEVVLVAGTRRPRVAALGLEEIAVEPNPRGLTVDERLRTPADGVYAAGEVTGRFGGLHLAVHEGEVAGRNAVGKRARVERRGLPQFVGLDPEVASIGMTEAAARERHRGVGAATIPVEALDRGQALGATGFVTLIAAGRGSGSQLVGAHLVGPGAGEMIGELALAMRWGVSLARIAQTLHAAPTMSEAIRRAAREVVVRG